MGRIRDTWDAMTGQSPVVQRALSYQGQFLTGESVTSSLGAGFQGTLSSVPFFAALRLIADNFSATPLQTFTEDAAGATSRVPDPAFLRPLTGTRATWLTQCIMSINGRGNAYGYITGVDRLGEPESIVWLDPAQVWCDENVIRPVFMYQGQELDSSRLVHIPWMVLPGRVTGLSPVEMFKTTFSMGSSAQDLANAMFTNGGVPIGHLRNSEKVLSHEDASVVSQRFHASIRGRKNFVSGSDWVYEAIGLPADDVRFMEAIKLTATQVATIFGIPPEDIGGISGSPMTYSTLEMNAQRLARMTMRPYYVRVEQALTDRLGGDRFVRFNIDAGVRADIKTRMESYAIGRSTGVITLDEARALENRPPLTAAQKAEYLAQFGPAAKTKAITRSDP